MKQKIFALVASGVFALNAGTPVAAITFQITGNGSNSQVSTVVNTTNVTTVVQNNNADIDNDINVDNNTGDNKAEDNTSGEVEINTGDSTTKVNVANTANSNSAVVDCCVSNDTTVKIDGNGTGTQVDAVIAQTNVTGVFQDNDADIDNDVDVDQSTGDNDAEDNTGGSVTIDTGDADSEVTLSTAANMNSAVVGNGSEQGSTLDVEVSGNGSEADIAVALVLAKDISVVQGNDADVDNDVDVDAETGDNEIEDSTGGENSIDTGDTTADVTVDTMVNFNAADVDCGCELDATAKIAENGTDSKVQVAATLLDTQEVFQGGEKGNEADLDNDVDVDGDTGDNEIEDSTAEAEDPMIETGDSDATVTVENLGNMNTYGEGAELPDMDFNVTFNLSLDMLLQLLGLE